MIELRDVLNIHNIPSLAHLGHPDRIVGVS